MPTTLCPTLPMYVPAKIKWYIASLKQTKRLRYACTRNSTKNYEDLLLHTPPSFDRLRILTGLVTLTQLSRR